MFNGGSEVATQCYFRMRLKLGDLSPHLLRMLRPIHHNWTLCPSLCCLELSPAADGRSRATAVTRQVAAQRQQPNLQPQILLESYARGPGVGNASPFPAVVAVRNKIPASSGWMSLLRSAPGPARPHATIAEDDLFAQHKLRRITHTVTWTQPLSAPSTQTRTSKDGQLTRTCRQRGEVLASNNTEAAKRRSRCLWTNWDNNPGN